MEEGRLVETLERIRELESELAGCRKRLEEETGFIPESELHALEVIVRGQRYLVPSRSIREVVKMALPSPLADAPDWVQGTVAFGDQTVPLVDLGRRLGGGPTEVTPDLYVVITEDPVWLGLVVESIGQTTILDPGSLAPPGPDVPCAHFLLASTHDPNGRVAYVLSIGRLGSELDG